MESCFELKIKDLWGFFELKTENIQFLKRKILIGQKGILTLSQFFVRPYKNLETIIKFGVNMCSNCTQIKFVLEFDNVIR